MIAADGDAIKSSLRALMEALLEGRDWRWHSTTCLCIERRRVRAGQQSRKKTSRTTGHEGQPSRAQTLPRTTSTEYSITLVIPTWPTPLPYFKAHCLNWQQEPYTLSEHDSASCVIPLAESACDVLGHNGRMLKRGMFYIPVTKTTDFTFCPVSSAHFFFHFCNYHWIKRTEAGMGPLLQFGTWLWQMRWKTLGSFWHCTENISYNTPSSGSTEWWVSCMGSTQAVTLTLIYSRWLMEAGQHVTLNSIPGSNIKTGNLLASTNTTKIHFKCPNSIVWEHF